MLNDIECVAKIEKCFLSVKPSEPFLKGCKWSPDGLCILSASNDNKIRLFEPNDANLHVVTRDCDPTLSYNEGGTIYDYTWYPKMTSQDPISCVFASSSKDSPVHLWDAFTGDLRATYQPINQFDEVHPAYSLCFTPEGQLFCGYKKELKIFDLSAPGRWSDKRCIKDHQTGIISSISFNSAMPTIYALGCYDKSVGLYTEPKGELLCLMQAHTGGVTQVQFSPDGHRLYSGARMDDNVLCWDLRMPGTIAFAVKRTVATSQRIQYDFIENGKLLITGSTDGNVSVYDTSNSAQESGFLTCEHTWQAHQDCANGVSVHPFEKIVATTSGQRHVHYDFSDDESDGCPEISESNMKIWKIPWSP